MRGVFLLFPLVLMFQATGALACINDRESQHYEKEFKSDYLDQLPPEIPQYEAEPSTGNELLVYGGSSAGIVLLISAGMLGLVRAKQAGANSQD